MAIETTHDLFWLLFGFSILLFTIFVCWGLFYMIMIARDSREVIKNLKNKLKMIDELITVIKEKVEDTSHYVKTIVEMALKVISWVQGQKSELEDNTQEKTRKKSK